MFYRNLFAALCFLFLALGFALHSPHVFWASLMCGAFSRTSVRKKWADPPFARKLDEWFQGKLRGMAGS